jgi:hypothetical protein
MKHSLRYLEPQGLLQPADAVVAIVLDEAGRYLVQHRDVPSLYSWLAGSGTIEGDCCRRSGFSSSCCRNHSPVSWRRFSACR